MSDAARPRSPSSSAARAASASQPSQHPALRSAIAARAARTATRTAFLQPAADPVDGPRAHRTADRRGDDQGDLLPARPSAARRDRRGARCSQRAQAAGVDDIRVWCAACATGEEAYSLALLACEAFAPADPPVRILATDISGAALEASRAGRYRERALRSVSPALRQRYFDQDGDALVVGDASGHRAPRSAQPRDRPDAAARRDGVRPDRLPERADLLRRRDGRPGDRRTPELLAIGAAR